MTVFTKTWQFDTNRVPAQSTAIEQAKYISWWIKAFLKGEIGGAASGLWTCEGSCDGTTAAMDGTDRWTASFDATKIATSTGAHSWMCLKSPLALGPYYMLLSKKWNQQEFVTITFSKNPFTAGSTTSTTVDPTSSTSFGMNVGSFIATTDGTGGAYHIHGMLATDGTFQLFTSKDGLNYFYYGVGLHELVNTRTGDNHKCWAFSDQVSSGTGVLNATRWNGSAVWFGRDKNNTVAVQGYASGLWYGTGLVMANLPTADATDGYTGAMPMFMYQASTSGASIRGRIADFTFGPTTAATLTVEPASGPVESTISGGVWIPFNAIPSL